MKSREEVILRDMETGIEVHICGKCGGKGAECKECRQLTGLDAFVRLLYGRIVDTQRGLDDIRECTLCDWRGYEYECRFGHDDFYCPKCCKEGLAGKTWGCRCKLLPCLGDIIASWLNRKGEEAGRPEILTYVGLLTDEQKRAGYFVGQDNDFVAIFRAEDKGRHTCVAMLQYETATIKEVRELAEADLRGGHDH